MQGLKAFLVPASPGGMRDAGCRQAETSLPSSARVSHNWNVLPVVNCLGKCLEPDSPPGSGLVLDKSICMIEKMSYDVK